MKANMPKINLSTRLIIFILVLLIDLACVGWVAGANNLIRLVTVGAGAILVIAMLVVGTLFIAKRFAERQRLVLVAIAAWYGFIFALLALLGMLLDPRTALLTWINRLSIASLIGVGSFIVILLALPINMLFIRGWRRSFGNPMSRPKNQH
jgi:hypothetical protein